MANLNSQSQIYLNNPAESIRRILSDNWDINITPKPQIFLILDKKRIDYRGTDWVLISAHDTPENYITLTRDYLGDKGTIIKIDVRTNVGHYHLYTLYSEIERIMLSVRKNIGYDNYNILSAEIKKTDKSNTMRRIYAMEIEFKIIEIIQDVTV